MNNPAPYKPTAYEMKYIVCRYMLYERSYAYAFSEWKNNGDVVALTKAMYATEVEIKVSLADLRSELKSIQGIRTHSWSKARKHEKYLYPDKRYDYDEVPKLFYFAVPDYLEEVAALALQDLPYGLLVARFREQASMQEYDMWWRIEEVKKAQDLTGSKKIEPVQLTECLQKAQNELMNYRRKVAMLAGEVRQNP